MMSLAAQSAGEAGTAATGSLARRLLLHASEVVSLLHLPTRFRACMIS